jgi:hypothetical protein
MKMVTSVSFGAWVGCGLFGLYGSVGRPAQEKVRAVACGGAVLGLD